MHKCDQCHEWKEKVNKQFVKRKIWKNPKCVFQICDDCSEAVVKQAARFEAQEEEARQLAAMNI